MSTNNVTSKRKRMGLGAVLFAVLAIFILTLAPAPTDTAVAANIQPELLALVSEQPDARVNVIVQKNAGDASVEALATQLGGTVTKELKFINAFAAEMPAENAVDLALDAGVNWVSLDAPVVRVSDVDSQTLRDEFNAAAYNNNDGTVNWSNDWQEVGEDGSVSSGGIRIQSRVDCTDPDCLLLRPMARKGAVVDGFVWREADLSGASQATLTYDFGSQQYAAGGQVAVEVSGDGGSSWTTLNVYTVDSFVTGTESFDISPYISDRTQIRFRFVELIEVATRIGFDNIQIEYTSSGASIFYRVIQANKLWHETPGIKGRDVTVAVVDSGIANHEDLQEDENTTFRIVAEVDFLNDSPTPDDIYGHGTHVAGIIAGNGKAQGLGHYGIAPKADLVDVKVIDDTGVGTISDVVAGLEWIYENKDLYNIRVVNLSLNSTMAESYHDSPLDAAVEILWFNGIVVVVSAGNNGSANPGVLYPPANDPFVIVVGATDDQGTVALGNDTIPTYSAYGVTTDGFAKPDLVAPGNNIISLLSSDTSNLALNHPDNIVASGTNSGYFKMSGTSMASAVVTGAVAQLLDDEPDLTPDQVKHRLMNTARTNWPGYDAQKAGAGILDIEAAVHATTMESANQDTMPHMLLAKMALIAYWASANGDENIDWATIDWESVNWDTVDWNSVNWGSVNWGSVNWGSVNWGSVNWGSVNWGSVNWGSVNWGSVNWGSVNWGSVNWGSVNAPSVDFSE
ncbi:MAG: S8 family serine peptidase [Chloroflexi bacterium]|nr:S8 family serine peptidase [Chloroflexota bacterium]